MLWTIWLYKYTKQILAKSMWVDIVNQSGSRTTTSPANSTRIVHEWWFLQTLSIIMLTRGVVSVELGTRLRLGLGASRLLVLHWFYMHSVAMSRTMHIRPRRNTVRIRAIRLSMPFDESWYTMSSVWMIKFIMSRSALSAVMMLTNTVRNIACIGATSIHPHCGCCFGDIG